MFAGYNAPQVLGILGIWAFKLYTIAAATVFAGLGTVYYPSPLFPLFLLASLGFVLVTPLHWRKIDETWGSKIQADRVIAAYKREHPKTVSGGDDGGGGIKPPEETVVGFPIKSEIPKVHWSPQIENPPIFTDHSGFSDERD